jgi:hypothetical protein
MGVSVYAIKILKRAMLICKANNLTLNKTYDKRPGSKVAHVKLNAVSRKSKKWNGLVGLAHGPT